ncbi:hypothetical protein BGX30_007928, partial [Mortierella sp. GBA39]
MSTFFQTHPLDLPEIRSIIASSLNLNDLASCARVSQDWNSSFTPPLYKTVILSEPATLRSLKKYEQFTLQVTIVRWSMEDFDEIHLISSIMAMPNLVTQSWSYKSLRQHEVEDLCTRLKINSTLTTLRLWYNSIGDSGAKALSEVLKTNSTLTTLRLDSTEISLIGAQA